MPLTEAKMIEHVYLEIGGEERSGILKPMIVATSRLALSDYAKFILDTNPELAKKLIVELEFQSWSDSYFQAPYDMLFYKQMETTRLDLGGVLCYQVADRDKLSMLGATSNHYYALEGIKFFIKHAGGDTSGSNLNLKYYAIPTVDSIDDEMMPVFLAILMDRIMRQIALKQNAPNTK